MPMSYPFSVWTLPISGVQLRFGQEHFTLILCEHVGLFLNSRLLDSQVLTCIFTSLVLITFVCLLKLTEFEFSWQTLLRQKKSTGLIPRTCGCFEFLIYLRKKKTWESAFCSSFIIYLSFFIYKIMARGNHGVNLYLVRESRWHILHHQSLVHRVFPAAGSKPMMVLYRLAPCGWVETNEEFWLMSQEHRQWVPSLLTVYCQWRPQELSFPLP